MFRAVAGEGLGRQVSIEVQPIRAAAAGNEAALQARVEAVTGAEVSEVMETVRGTGKRHICTIH